jgi:hypothetical protein
MIYDAAGRITHQQGLSAAGQDKLDIDQLPAGQYFIRLSGSAPSISAPVIIGQ